MPKNNYRTTRTPAPFQAPEDIPPKGPSELREAHLVDALRSGEVRELIATVDAAGEEAWGLRRGRRVFWSGSWRESLWESGATLRDVRSIVGDFEVGLTWLLHALSRLGPGSAVSIQRSGEHNFSATVACSAGVVSAEGEGLAHAVRTALVSVGAQLLEKGAAE